MKKKFLLICSLVLLTACGFTPMLQKNEIETNHGAKLIVESFNKDGNSYLVQMLSQRLKISLSGLPLDHAHKIYIRLGEEAGNLAYATDATAMRSMMRLTAQIIISYQGTTLYETKLSSVTSYSQNASDEFINQSAVQGAQERLIEALTIDVSREVQQFVKNQQHSKNKKIPSSQMDYS